MLNDVPIHCDTFCLLPNCRTDVALAFQVWDQEHLIAFWPRVEKDDKVTDEANEMLIQRPLLIENISERAYSG